jgi:hypothetical protein
MHADSHVKAVERDVGVLALVDVPALSIRWLISSIAPSSRSVLRSTPKPRATTVEQSATFCTISARHILR